MAGYQVVTEKVLHILMHLIKKIYVGLGSLLNVAECNTDIWTTGASLAE